MTANKNISRKIIINFSAIQFIYFASIVPYMLFAVVFLEYRGLTNSQIGVVMSAAAIAAIVIQMCVSDFADRYNHIPLKFIIILFYIIVLFIGGIFIYGSPSIIAIMVAFTFAQALVISVLSLLSAAFMQFQNTGLNINFGIPRGSGSISCALTTYVLGVVVQNHSPEILFPIQLFLSVLFILSILILPKPESITGRHPDQSDKAEKPSSLVGMLKGNPTFVMFMFAVIFSSVSQSYMNFMINLVRSVGGGTVDLGAAIFINCIFELPPMLLAFWLLKKYKNLNLLVLSIIVTLVKTIGVALAPSVGWIYFSLTLSFAANGIFYLISVYYINEIVKPNERTRGQALIGLCSFAGLGAVIGGVVDGFLIDQFGVNAMMLFCTVCGIISVVLMFYTAKMHQKHFGRSPVVSKS